MIACEKRTTQDFVEDLVSNGRSWKQIRMIATCTRWRECKEEVEQQYRELRSRRKKISNRNKREKENGKEREK